LKPAPTSLWARFNAHLPGVRPLCPATQCPDFCSPWDSCVFKVTSCAHYRVAWALADGFNVAHDT